MFRKRSVLSDNTNREIKFLNSKRDLAYIIENSRVKPNYDCDYCTLVILLPSYTSTFPTCIVCYLYMYVVPIFRIWNLVLNWQHVEIYHLKILSTCLSFSLRQEMDTKLISWCFFYLVFNLSRRHHFPLDMKSNTPFVAFMKKSFFFIKSPSSTMRTWSFLLV